MAVIDPRAYNATGMLCMLCMNPGPLNLRQRRCAFGAYCV